MLVPTSSNKHVHQHSRDIIHTHHSPWKMIDFLFSFKMEFIMFSNIYFEKRHYSDQLKLVKMGSIVRTSKASICIFSKSEVDGWYCIVLGSVQDGRWLLHENMNFILITIHKQLDNWKNGTCEQFVEACNRENTSTIYRSFEHPFKVIYTSYFSDLVSRLEKLLRMKCLDSSMLSISILLGVIPWYFVIVSDCHSGQCSNA